MGWLLPVLSTVHCAAVGQKLGSDTVLRRVLQYGVRVRKCEPSGGALRDRVGARPSAWPCRVWRGEAQRANARALKYTVKCKAGTVHCH